MTPITLPSFESGRVLVIGDLMLDRYWSGPTSRISPEAPVPVVKIQQHDDRAGGAGNVALNIAALGGQTDLVGIVGQDDNAEQLAQLLAQSGISNHWHAQADYPTITKLRILSRQQQLIRLDFEDAFGSSYQQPLSELTAPLFANAQAVVLSDYGKGTLTDPQPFIRQAIAAKVPVLVDPKGSDFERYRGATIITPNLSEFEAVVGHCPDDETLVSKAQALLVELELEAVLVTRSEKGMSLIQRQQSAVHIPTRARDVFDVTGAGDTVIATLAAAYASGADWIEAMEIANAAAGIVVGKVGTATASTSELHNELHDSKIYFSPERLQTLLQRQQQQGEKIVMTNGCFDILHPGHVQYLQEAKALGNTLVVAVNSDDSVKRLKGDSRPINSVEHRMAVLAGLGCVDYLVPFEQDTPAELIAQLSPNILVKGGDYKIEDIAGGEHVMASGGDVIILSFKDNCSTSAIVQKIQETSA